MMDTHIPTEEQLERETSRETSSMESERLAELGFLSDEVALQAASRPVALPPPRF